MQDLVTAWRGAMVGELCWIGPRDRPEAAPVTPLLLDDTPCLAIPYAHRVAVRELAAAPEAALVVSDARAAADRGVLAVGPVRVEDDLEGTRFAERLLPQELAKYPPSRTLADTLLLRRENWWWLPRLIVTLDAVRRVEELLPRTDPDTEALLVRERSGLRVDTVRVPATDADRVTLTPLDGGELRGDGAPALLLGHDYTLPDLERWEPWTVRGRLVGDELEPRERDGHPGQELAPLGLLARIRRQRWLERSCRREISEAERAR